MSYVSYPNSIPKQSRTHYSNVFSNEMSLQGTKDESQIMKHCSISSSDDLKKRVQEILAGSEVTIPPKSGTSSSVIKKNCMRRSSSQSNVRPHSSKPISVEQQRAADAQMHAPTHSHSISKCYCNQSNNLTVLPETKYIIQLYGRKQHLPPRLKRQRYRSVPLPKDSRNVRWADKNGHLPINSPKSGNIELATQSREPLEVTEDMTYGHEMHPSNQSAYCHHQLSNNLLERVKTFRESHWSDCHALSGASTSPTDHECVQHYMLNNRLFLEPLHRDGRCKDSCPVCSRSPPTSEKTLCNHVHFQSVSPSNQTSHVLVTLPKLILEQDDSNCKLISGPSSVIQSTNTKKRVKQKSCFLIGHRKLVAEEKFCYYPRDSLALKYQR